MWICQDCGTENEDNFKFCWSCGQNKAQAETAPEPPKPIEKIPEVKEKPPIEDVDEMPIITRVNPRPKAQSQKSDDDEDILPMFSRVTGVERNESLTDDDTSLEKKVFTIALRLIGLFFLYRFFAALPDMIVLVSSALRENREDISEMFTSSLLYPAARILIYFVVGIYLIASGRILIWLLPNR
ncbi:hypothetical protein BH20ACI4_BH20ACI4_29870 [soil metagenome]